MLLAGNLWNYHANSEGLSGWWVFAIPKNGFLQKLAMEKNEENCGIALVTYDKKQMFWKNARVTGGTIIQQLKYFNFGDNSNETTSKYNMIATLSWSLKKYIRSMLQSVNG